MAMTLKEIELLLRMIVDGSEDGEESGDEVCRALAGSLLMGEDDLSTVSVFKHPLYGTSSYLRRMESRATLLESKISIIQG